MTSPYVNRNLKDWLDELPGHLQDSGEGGVDLTAPQVANLEVAGPRVGRDALQAKFEKEGWATELGLGAEPDATVFFWKRDVWTPERLRETISACFNMAKDAGCVFEGLYVTKLN